MTANTRVLVMFWTFIVWYLTGAAVLVQGFRASRGGPYPRIRIEISEEVHRNVTLNCMASHYLNSVSEMAIWYKDGVPIVKLGEKGHFLEDSAFNLHILSIQCSDRGNYTCKLFDENALIAKIDYQLQVFNRTASTFCTYPSEAPVIVVRRPFSGRVLQPELSALTLVCVATGTPYPTFTWLKDGVDINSVQFWGLSARTTTMKTKRGPKIAVRSVLHVEELGANHTGEYECCASNQEGMATKKFQVEAIERATPEPPIFLPGYPSSSTSCFIAETVFLACRVQSETPVALSWFKLSENVLQQNMSSQEFMLLMYLASENRTRFDGFFSQTIEGRVHLFAGNIWQAELEIVNSSEYDSGHYTCLARNFYDISYTTVLLTVREPTQDNYVWLIIATVIVPICCLLLCHLRPIIQVFSQRGVRNCA